MSAPVLDKETVEGTGPALTRPQVRRAMKLPLVRKLVRVAEQEGWDRTESGLSVPSHRLGVDVDAPIPPAHGYQTLGGGFDANVIAGSQWQATTSQLCGLFPFAAPSGTAVRGVPIGTHQHTGESLGLDPAQWLADGLVGNTGIWVQGQPGIGKSTLVKRLILGLAAFGFVVQILGDLKDEYEDIIAALGGTVIRLGRGEGRHSVNPLDMSAIRQAINAQTDQQERQKLLDDARDARLALLEALLTIQTGRDDLSSTHRLLLARALDLADEANAREGVETVIPDVLKVMMAAPEALRETVAELEKTEYDRFIRELRSTLELMVDGAIKGLFDRQSTFEVNPLTPAMSLSLKSIEKNSDAVVASSMMCAWAWSAQMIEARRAMGQATNVLKVMDELWRALRVSGGLTEKADRTTRLGRNDGEVSVMVTHSLEDLEALASESDRAKARTLASRNDIKIFGGCDFAEIERAREISSFTDVEASMVTSWGAPPTWVRGAVHPGRGKYMVKVGTKTGLPVSTKLTPTERRLYYTDGAFDSIRDKRM